MLREETRPTVLALREYIRNVNTIHQQMFDRLLQPDAVSAQTVVTLLDAVGQKCLSMSRDLSRTLDFDPELET